MKITYTILMSLICIEFYGCGNNKEVEPVNSSNKIIITDSMKLVITVGAKVFTATLYNNATVTEFKSKLTMSINMIELNGNEKYFDLSGNLPANASNPGTIQAGDLMLYGSNTLVLFYKTFSTPYTYTRLGRIDNPSGLAAVLGSGSVSVTFETE